MSKTEKRPFRSYVAQRASQQPGSGACASSMRCARAQSGFALFEKEKRLLGARKADPSFTLEEKDERRSASTLIALLIKTYEKRAKNESESFIALEAPYYYYYYDYYY